MKSPSFFFFFVYDEEEMIHRTVVNDMSRMNQSNVHLFKLITTYDNKSVDQIERVYI